MEELIQEKTAQVTDENRDTGKESLPVITDVVNTSDSEPVEEESMPVIAERSGLVEEEAVKTEDSVPVEAINIEPVITEAVSAETVAEQKPGIELKSVLEALLFITSDPLEPDKIQEIIGTGFNGQKLDKKQIREALAVLQTDYQNRNSALQLVEIANGWQLCTKKEFAIWLDKLAKNKEVYKLSNSALETLSIIAYKQPLTRAEVEHIRGVDSGGVIHNLLEKRLVRITGRKDVIGHPLLYGTSDDFLQYFGLASLADLPMLEDLNKS